MKGELSARLYENNQIQVYTDGNDRDLLIMFQMMVIALSHKSGTTPKQFLEDLLKGTPNIVQEIQYGFKSKKSDLLDKLMRSVAANLPEMPQRLEDN